MAMETRSTWRATPQVVLGIIIVLIGVVFTLDNMDILYAHDYLRYWPALLVLYGLSKLVQPGSAPGRFSGIIFTLIGGALLLDRLDVFAFRLWDFWPLIIIVIGLSMIWRTFSRSGRSPHDIAVSEDSGATISGVAFMSGFKRNSNTQNFMGGELTAIMGGCEIDLRQASMKDGEAVIDVFAFWGGIELKVPLDWSVVIEATPLLGGFEDKTRSPQGGSAKRLIIKGYAIMGGFEVTN
jgi:predicted membrane protein